MPNFSELLNGSESSAVVPPSADRASAFAEERGNDRDGPISDGYNGRMADVTQILSQIQQGDPTASEQLLPLVYDELRKLAATRLANERPGQTLQATALVNEAYIRLVDKTSHGPWDSRGHFFVAAAEAMRRILIEQARRKSRVKHGGGRNRVAIENIVAIDSRPQGELLALHEALAKFEAMEPAKADLVKLRYFAGFSIDEAADLLHISRSTAKRHWTYARAWLLAEISGGDLSKKL